MVGETQRRTHRDGRCRAWGLLACLLLVAVQQIHVHAYNYPQRLGGCYLGPFPTWYRYGKYDSVDSCAVFAKNNDFNYFGLTEGGKCTGSSSLSLSTTGDACDWTCHSGCFDGSCSDDDTGSGVGSCGSAGGRTNVYSMQYSQCGSLNVANGVSGCGSSTSHRGTCSLSCATGYSASGSGSYKCMDGSWTGGSLVCTVTKCAALATAPLNGDKGTCAAMINYGTTCNANCPAPYKLSGNPYACTSGFNNPLSGSQTCLPPCEGPPAALEQGTWTKRASDPAPVGTRYMSGTRFDLACGAGRTPVNSPATCGTDGQWSTNSFCLDLAVTPKLSINLTTMSPYSGRVVWSNPNIDALMAEGKIIADSFTYRFRPTLVFPVPDGTDSTQPPLRGVQFAGGNTFASSGNKPYTQLVADVNEEIEHARFNLVLEATYTDRWTNQVSVGPQTTTSISLPCSCNQEGALANPLLDPNTSLMYGTPLDMSVLQLLNSANQLQVRFTPNSLCTDKYTIFARGLDGTPESPSPVDIIPVTVQQLSVSNTQSCSFLTSQKESVVTVAYPIHGRPLSICLQPLPRPICPTCSSSYGTLLAEGSSFAGSMPSTCVNFTVAFFAGATGVVTTKASALAPIPAPVPDVLITLTVLHADSRLPVMVDDGAGGLKHLNVTVVTDEKGRYKAQISSTLLRLEKYALEVRAHKRDVDPDTGDTFDHILTHVASQTDPFYVDLVVHADVLTGINFVDLSEVPLSGKVTLSPTATHYGSVAFQDCGVSGVVLTAYGIQDTLFQAPLRRAVATGPDGSFSLTSPLYTKIVLVPSIANGQVNHTFEPPMLLVTVRQSALQLAPFVDTTMAEFDAQFDGGLCHFPIGAVAPVVKFLSCNAQIVLPPFGQLKKTYRLPAQLYQFKLFVGSELLSGLQALDIDGETPVPGTYRDGPVGQWVAQRPADVLDLTDALTPETRPPLLHYTYIEVADVALETPPICRDDLVPESAGASQAAYTYMNARAMNYVTFVFTESYGWPATPGGPKPRVCTQVDAKVMVLDGVTQTGDALLPYYADAPFRCGTADPTCVVLPGQFNSNSSRTSATYLFFAGDIEQASMDDGTGAHIRPAYSKSIQYKLAGSVLPLNALHVVLLGTKTVDGSLSLTYPPWDALYILRDPPGGASTAAISAGSSMRSETGLSVQTDTSSSASIMAGLATELEGKMCLGIGAEVCSDTVKLEATLQVGGSAGTVSSAAQETMSASEHTFSSGAITSSQPSMVNGLGDLFLTISGSLQVQSAWTVSGEIVRDAANAGTATCTTTKRPTVSWQRDPSNTLAWSSAYDIEFVTIPTLEKTNAKILAQWSVMDKDGLKARRAKGEVTAEVVRVYEDNEVAIAGWRGLLIYNQYLKDNSVPWPEFYQSDHNACSAAD